MLNTAHTGLSKKVVGGVVATGVSPPPVLIRAGDKIVTVLAVSDRTRI